MYAGIRDLNELAAADAAAEQAIAAEDADDLDALCQDWDMRVDAMKGRRTIIMCLPIAIAALFIIILAWR